MARMKSNKINRREANRKESKVIKDFHEDWAKKNGYRETSNEQLNIENSERFVNDTER
jgi:hypothetical protein